MRVLYDIVPDHRVIFSYVIVPHVADDERGVALNGHFGLATDFEQQVQRNGHDDDPINVVFVCVGGFEQGSFCSLCR